MRPLLLLDASQEPPWADSFFRPWLAPRAVRVVRVGTEPPSLAPGDVSGVVITGSAASVRDDADWIHRVRRWLTHAVDAGVPMLGVCWGHQMLATVLAGVSSVGLRAPEVGYPEVRVEPDDELLGVLAPGLRPYVTHEDFVDDDVPLPVLASSDDCRVHALRAKDRPVWGVQFHVEYPRSEQRRILEYRRDRHPARGFDPDALLADAPDLRPAAAALFGRFLDIAS